MKICVNAKKNPVSAIVGKLIRGDENTTAIHIRVPRWAGGVDLGGLSWKINIENAVGTTDVYVPGDVSVDEAAIGFTWLPAGVATSQPGITRFEIEGAGGTEEVPLMWQSAAYILKIEDDIDARPAGEEDIPAGILSPENAGKLLYIASDGSLQALLPGDGLAIRDGMLVLTGSTSTTTAAVCGSAVCGEAICGKE